jgi:dTDP-4-dehydrorhamnose reductase
VLVMGGTGFVGSAICAALRAHGDDVVATDIAPPRPATARLLEGIPFIGVRVQDFYEVLGAVRDTGPDVLVNLSYIAGAASEEAPFIAGLVNLQGPLNCLEAAAFCGVRRVVYASSIAVYGPDQQLYGERDVTEDDSCPIAAHTLSYGAAKAINEFMTRKLAQHHGLDVTGLRLSIVFGAGREKGFTTWASDIGSLPAVGEEVAIPYRAEQRSSLIYVDVRGRRGGPLRPRRPRRPPGSPDLQFGRALGDHEAISRRHHLNRTGRQGSFRRVCLRPAVRIQGFRCAGVPRFGVPADHARRCATPPYGPGARCPRPGTALQGRQREPEYLAGPLPRAAEDRASRSTVMPGFARVLHGSDYAKLSVEWG